MSANDAAAKHLRTAMAELRAAKCSLAKAREYLPRGNLDTELGALPPEVLKVESVLVRAARRLEAGRSEQLVMDEVAP